MKKDKKNSDIHIRVSSEERRAMHEAAKQVGVSLSELVRTLVLQVKKEQELNHAKAEDFNNP